MISNCVTVAEMNWNVSSLICSNVSKHPSNTNRVARHITHNIGAKVTRGTLYRALKSAAK